MTEYAMTVNGHELLAHPDDTAVIVFQRNHLLDHLIVVDKVVQTTDAILVPRGFRLYRELFEKNDISFDEMATELVSLQFPLITHEHEIPDYFLEQYSQTAMNHFEREWEYYSGE